MFETTKCYARRPRIGSEGRQSLLQPKIVAGVERGVLAFATAIG